jgi:hypothetical protein
MYASAKTKILRFFFDLIENDNKEPVDMTDLTIEHIMPETLSLKWQDDLGDNYQEIYDKYVHTLGNLSITGYNSEYSNDPFTDKKKLFNEMVSSGDSKIIKLNTELLDNDINSWSSSEIENRAERLSKVIISKFPYPTNIDTSLEFEKYYEFYIDNPDDDGDEYANNPSYKLYGFMFDGIKYPSMNFRSIYRDIIKILYKLDNTILDEMAKQNLTYEYGSTILFSTDLKNNHQDEILPNLYVYTNYNRNSIFEWIRELFKKYQLDIKDFCLLYVEKD